MKIRIIMMVVLMAFPLQRISAQDTALSTNVLGYADMGTMNVEASYGIARHWTLNMGMRYNPFTFQNKTTGTQMQSRQQSYSVGARFWPWHIFSGWWLSGKMQYQEYNEGGIRSLETSEGDRYGSGLSGGYTYMLGNHFNVELGLGVWAGYDKYTTYACPSCGRTIAKGERVFLLPNDIMLSLSYVF